MNAAAREFASHARQLSPDALSPSTFGSQLARTVRQRTPAAWLSHLASEHHVLVNMLQYALHEATQQKYDPAIALTRDRLTVHHQAAREFGLCADGDQLPDA